MSRVSYVMMNPGGERQLTARGPRRRSTSWSASCAPRPESTADIVLEIVLVGNPIMHHIVLGIDPTPLGQAPFTLATAEADRSCRRATSSSICRQRAGLRRRRASPVTSAPTRPRSILAEGPHRRRRDAAARRRRHQRRDRARRPRPPVRRVEPHRAGVRGRPDQLRPARHGGRDRAGAHRPRSRSSRGSGSSAATCGATNPASPRRRRARRHRHLRLGHHRGRSARCSSPASSTATASIQRRSWPSARRASSPTAARSLRRCHDAGDARAARSRRTTCARSSWPRPRCAPASSCCSSTPASPTVDDIRLAGAFGAHIDPVYALVLGLVPDCPVERVRSVGNAAGAGAVRALLSMAARHEMEAAVRQVDQDRDRHRARVPGAVRRGDGVPARHRTVAEPGARSSTCPQRTDVSHVGDGRRAVVAAHATSRTDEPTTGRSSERSGPDGTDRTESGAGRRVGRAGRARQRCAPSHVIERVPYLTRTMTPFEIVSDEGLDDHRAQRRHDPRRGRRRDPRLSRARCRSSPQPAPTSTAPGCGSRAACAAQIVQATAPATYTQHARNPANNVADRRRRHGVRPQLRLAVRARPRQRPPLRHARRLPELREARVHVAEPAPLGRHGVRAGRRAGQQAPPRHGVLAHQVQRQGRSWARSPPARGPQDSVELARIALRRRPAGPHRDDEPDQRLVAAGVGRHDARRGARSTPRTTRRRSSRRSSSPARWRRRPVAGVAAQTLAEALAGMTFVQLVRPGAPVIFGSFASSMSMQTGAPTFGTPEPAIVLYTVAALARRLGVPFRSGGSLTASKLPDAQAAYESAARCSRRCSAASTSCCTRPAGWRAGWRSATRSSCSTAISWA